MRGYGKDKKTKVRSARRSNEYGGRHRALASFDSSRQDLLQDVVDLYQSVKRTTKEFTPEVKFFTDIQTIKPKGDKPTADEGQKAVNYLMNGLNDIIKKHTGFDPHILHAEDTGLLMKAIHGAENHNKQIEEVERQLRDH